jgi:hypothetical protein
METRNFKERFRESQNFEDFVKDVMARAGTVSAAGTFPKYTQEAAEELVLGWSNQLEAIGTVLQPKK